MGTERCELLSMDLPHAERVRAAIPPAEDAQRAAEQPRALGDATRLRVAAALALGSELCVCDLAWVCELSQNLVSHHLRQLRAADLAGCRRDGKLVMYRLTPRGRQLLSAVMGGADPRPWPGELVGGDAGGTRGER